MTDVLGTTIGQSIKVRQDICKDAKFITTFSLIAKSIKAILDNGGTIFVAGNGGSASDAQHFVAELVGRFEKERPAFRAECLNTDTAVLTAIANDYGYDQVFSRQLGKMHPRDGFLAISTSGNSPNILTALQTANQFTMGKTFLLTGKDGGQAVKLATHSLIVPSNRTSVIQGVHSDLLHSLAECIEK